MGVDPGVRVTRPVPIFGPGVVYGTVRPASKNYTIVFLTQFVVVNYAVGRSVDRVRDLVAFVEKHGRLPSKGENDLRGEKALAQFWNSIKGAQKCHKSLYTTVLSKNKILRASYEKAQKKQTNRSSAFAQTSLSDSQLVK